LLNAIRESGPLWMREDVLVLSSHASCEAALRAPDAVAVSGGACPVSAERVRRLVDHGIGADAVAALVPVVRSVVDERLDSVADRGRLEAVSDLAYPVPMAVLCHLLGVPAGDGPWLHRQAMALAPALDPYPALLGADEPPGLVEYRQAQTALDAYFAEAIGERRRRAAGDDLLSRLIREPGSGEGLTDADIASACRDLVGAGYETTAGLVSGGILALLRAPHEMAALRRDPGHARQLVEEVLRLDPPLQVVQRRATADLDVCGIRVPKGTVMVLLLAAAHRDPALGPGPDLFVPGGTRTHLAFGTDPRDCLGAPLARLIASTVLVRFAQRVTGARFATGSPSYRPTTTLRGLRALWVAADGFTARDLPWGRRSRSARPS
ncbi:cytochrome P450, partial [Streptomyces antarcticus]